jgi:1,4-alpha-glucan branching enzyme
MIFGQLPHGGQFVFQVEVHSLSQPMTQRFRGSAPILPQSSFRYPQGSGQGNSGGVEAERLPWHHQPNSLRITLPPLSASFFMSQGGAISP